MENEIKAIKIVQNNQEFLLGAFKMRKIREFTRFTERLIVGYVGSDVTDDFFENQPQVVPLYNSQIQRKANNAKVERIADFLIYDSTAMFPTNIVIAIPQQVIVDMSEDADRNVLIKLDPIVQQELRRPNGDVFLTIVDGQHRIKGIERAIERMHEVLSDPAKVEERAHNQAILERLLDLELVVTFFVDPVLEYQAMIFSIINKTQTKVPESLVYSLFGLSSEDTPQKTSLEVVLALNGLERSPFYDRIKLVGGNYQRGVSIPLSQATMVKSILYSISKNQRESEIDRTRARRTLAADDSLAFRKYYIEGNDKMIVRIMYTFFSAVREAFTDAQGNSYWTLGSTPEVNVLQTNVGYMALMRLLMELLKIIPEEQKDNKVAYLAYLMRAQDINWLDDGPERRYPFTSRSVSLLFRDLREQIGV